MANAYVEFVKDYQKKNNIKSYKEAISKASAEWRKKKGEISKDKEKKTDKVKEVKEKQKEQKRVKVSKTATSQGKDQDILNRIKKRSGAIVIKANKDLREGKITEEDHDKLIREAVETAKEKEEKLTDLTSVLSSLKGGAIEQMEVKPISKAERTKKLKKYKKIRAEVFKALDEGKRSDNITEFRKLATELKGNSEKNAYARDLKKLERTLGSKKFGKREEKLKKKGDNLKMVITEQKEPKGVSAKAGVSETAFGKEQDLLNRVRKKVGAELKSAAKRFNDGKISETEYTTIIDNIKNEVEERERARDNAIKALPAGRRAEARLLADVRDAIGGEPLPSVAKAKDTVVKQRISQKTKARVLTEKQAEFVNGIMNASDVRQMIDALLPTSRKGRRLTALVLENAIKRVKGFQARMPNDTNIEKLVSKMGEYNNALEQAIIEKTLGSSAGQVSAPATQPAPTQPIAVSAKESPERIGLDMEDIIDNYIRKNPNQLGQRLGDVHRALDDFVSKGEYKLGRKTLRIPEYLTLEQNLRQQISKSVFENLKGVYTQYRPSVDDTEVFRIGRMNPLYDALDDQLHKRNGYLAYTTGSLITGKTAKELNVPKDYLEPIDVSGNRSIVVMTPDGEEQTIDLEEESVSQARDKAVEELQQQLEVGASRTRLRAEKSRDLKVEELPSPEEFELFKRASTKEEAQEVAKTLNLSKYPFKGQTYDTDTGFININPLKSADVVARLARTPESERDFLDKQVEAKRSGETTGEGFASMAPQPELFSKDEMDEMGGSLIGKAKKAYDIVKKIHDRLLRFAKHKKVKGVEKADQLELDLTKQSYNKPEKRKQNVKGFVYQPELSSDELAVYQNPATKRVVMAHRGSSNMDDLKTDLRLAVGGITKTKRYERDNNRLEAVQSAFPDDRIDFTGHSLGGTVAIEMNSLLPKGKSSAVVFNAGHTPFRNLSVKDRDITYYTHKGDIVSMLGANSYKNVKYIDEDKSNPISAHTLDAFKDEDGKDFEEPVENEASSLVPIEGGALVKKDVRKMKKHIEGIMREGDENEKIRRIEKMMKDTDKLPNSFMKKEMLKLAHQLLNN